MAKNPKIQITDDEILAMNEVPVRMAADYLGMTYDMLAWQLQEKLIPVGTAKQGKKWAYHINPQALVNYKHGEEDNSILNVIHKQLEENQKQLAEIRQLFEQYQTLRSVG